MGGGGQWGTASPLSPLHSKLCATRLGCECDLVGRGWQLPRRSSRAPQASDERRGGGARAAARAVPGTRIFNSATGRGDGNALRVAIRVNALLRDAELRDVGVERDDAVLQLEARQEGALVRLKACITRRQEGARLQRCVAAVRLVDLCLRGDELAALAEEGVLRVFGLH